MLVNLIRKIEREESSDGHMDGWCLSEAEVLRC